MATQTKIEVKSFKRGVEVAKVGVEKLVLKK